MIFKIKWVLRIIKVSNKYFLNFLPSFLSISCRTGEETRQRKRLTDISLLLPGQEHLIVCLKHFGALTQPPKAPALPSLRCSDATQYSFLRAYPMRCGTAVPRRSGISLHRKTPACTGAGYKLGRNNRKP